MMKLLTLAALVLISGSATAQLSPSEIDGVITFNERQDAVRAKPYKTGNENFLVRSDEKYYYIGIHSETIASANVVLNKGDEFIVIHLSGCTGRGIYKRVAGDSLAVIRPIYNVATDPDKWDVVGCFASGVALKKTKTRDQQISEMQQCLQQHGYMGSTLDLGSYRDAEILLDRKIFAGYKLLMQNTELITVENAVQGRRTYFPAAGVKKQSAMQKFLACEAGTGVAVSFELKEWIDLSTL